jgi:hypothetical protein
VVGASLGHVSALAMACKYTRSVVMLYASSSRVVVVPCWFCCPLVCCPFLLFLCYAGSFLSALSPEAYVSEDRDYSEEGGAVTD